MPQAIKRFYGSSGNSSDHLIYTCPSNTVAKVKVVSLVLQQAYVYQHTSATTNNSYRMLGATSSERSEWHVVGEKQLGETRNAASGAVETFPVAQYGAENGQKVGSRLATAGTSYTANGLYLYPSEWYISAGQRLYIKTNAYTASWDFVIIEEAGSGT